MVLRRYFSLKRWYVGPTSMDAELAFSMAHMACVAKDYLVIDLFCGTAGIMMKESRGVGKEAAPLHGAKSTLKLTKPKFRCALSKVC